MKFNNRKAKEKYIFELWEKEDDYLDATPDREMIYFFLDGEDEHELCLECNTDFLAWELELLD